MFKILPALALLLLVSPLAMADCLSDDPTRVKSDAAEAMNNALAQKDARGINLPLVRVGQVNCNNGLWASSIGCSASLSGRSGQKSYSINCTASFKNCGTPSASCRLDISQ